MKKESRWLKSVLAASTEAAQATMPWQRGAKQRPAAFKAVVVAMKPRAIAAR